MRKSFARGLLLVATLLFANPLIVRGQTVERSLDEWLAAQGTFCIPDGSGGCQQFLAPLANQLGWEDPERNRCAVVDYLGAPDVTGTVKEHELGDGRALITVRLVVSNALTYAVSGPVPGCDILGGPLVFGYRPQEVLAGATPSLADGTSVLKFTVDAPGLPLPDVVRLIVSPSPSELIELIRFDGDSYGQLRSAFGVPEGTPGKLAIRDVFKPNNGHGILIKHRIDLSAQ